MIDNDRIISGFDVELNFGSIFFLNIFQASFDANIYERTITVPGTIPIALTLGRPLTLEVGYNTDDITVEVPVSHPLGTQNVLISFNINIDQNSNNLIFEYSSLDQATIDLINQFGDANQLGIILGNLLNFEFPLDFLDSDAIAHWEKSRINGSGNYQNVIALFINSNLDVSPQQHPPNDNYIPRGNVNNALSILPNNKSFSVGISSYTFNRIANDIWHQEAILDDNEWIMSIEEEDDQKAKIKFLKINTRNGFVEVEIGGTINSILPDPSLSIKFELTPSLNQGVWSFNNELVEYEIDSGFWGSLIGFVGFGLIGGLIFGPAGFFIGGTLGVGAIEGGEELLENWTEGTTENSLSSKISIESLFDFFPKRIDLFIDNSDPFYSSEYFINNQIDSFNLDSNGLSFCGSSEVYSVNSGKTAIIVDVVRGNSINSRFGIDQLIYTSNEIDGTVALFLDEILDRLSRNEISTAEIKATDIHRTSNKIVSHIKFDSELELRTLEAATLQFNNILKLKDVILVRPINGEAYFRAKPDDNISNNFESLPPFDPSVV